MCGIVGAVSKSSVNQSIYDALTVLQHRGQDAAGIVTYHNGRLFQRKSIGLVSDVSNVISSELKVNIRSLSINTEGGIFEGNIQLYVEDTNHIDTLIKKLEKVQGVVKVSRLD